MASTVGEIFGQKGRLLGHPTHSLGCTLRAVVLDEAAVARGLVLMFVDQVVKQRVQSADPRKIGLFEQLRVTHLKLYVGRRRDQCVYPK